MIKYQTTLDGISEEQLQGFFVGWQKPLSASQHLEVLHNSAHVMLAYDSDLNKVVGFINALSDQVNFAFIPMLEVLPTHQGQGIGRKLLQLMLTELEHITCIDLTCDAGMQSWYAQFGMLQSHGMVMRKYLNH